MKITSPAFKNNGPIPLKYTCDGENINPALEINDVPQNAESLALIMEDPDATIGTWVHWTIFNILPEIVLIAENSVPEKATQGLTGFGKPGYGGPCPPTGTHRYFFKLYALDSVLNLGLSAKKEDIEKAMKNHILQTAELIGLYKR